MSKKLPENGFEWVEESSQINEDLIKDYDDGYFLEVDVEYSKKLFSLHNDLPLLSERKN